MSWGMIGAIRTGSFHVLESGTVDQPWLDGGPDIWIWV